MESKMAADIAEMQAESQAQSAQFVQEVQRCQDHEFALATARSELESQAEQTRLFQNRVSPD